MAGTRRRSRVNDTRSALEHPSAAPQSTSITDQSTAAELLKSPEILESAEAASTHNESPVSRSTRGFCKNCGGNIGEYFNSWYKVTGSYYMPALLGSYKSLLNNCGEQKAASWGTAIEGCTIQPLSCPRTGCLDTPIGFTVVQAPSGKTHFRGRDFFKLNRIELRCEAPPGRTIIVEPTEESAPEPLAVEDLNSPSPTLARVTAAPPSSAMEIDSRPPLSQHPGLHMHTRQPLPPPLSMRSPTTLPPMQSIPPKSSSNPMASISPAVRPLHDPPYSTQPSPRESSISSASRRDFPPGSFGHLRSPGEVQNANGSAYPRSPAEVSLDAIERLQTQISQNSGALAAHTRDIRRGEESFQQLETSLRRDFAAQVQRQSLDIQRVDEAVARMHMEMQTMRQAIEGISHELVVNRTEMQRGAASQLGQPAGVPDAALELIAQQVTGLAHKATEVDMLKVTIEIMKKKIHRLEQGVSVPGPSSHTNAHGLKPSQVPPPSQHIPSLQNTPTTGPSDSPLANNSHPAPHPSSSQLASSTLPDGSHRLDSTPGLSTGWASINSGIKRAHANGVEASNEGAVHVPGSPKRQKTVAADPIASHVPSQDQTPQHVFERRESDASTPRLHVPPTLPSQQPIPDATLLSQTQQSAYTPYGTQDGPSDDSWRPESQRNIEHRPRGRPRGGPGSRGGRVRKSMPVQVHPLSTPEWEREDWQGVPESQAGPDGFYNHVAHAGRGIARRGSGGGGRGGHTQSDRAASLGSQGIPVGFGMGSQNDPYSHTKKTRTKPIRNADGVLIRKDGRPDMRSQSSAANLRKVHARKEGEQSTQGSPTGFTPANLPYGHSAGSPESPSPSGFAHPDPNATPSAQQKHNAIMGKMFPGGLLESRRQHDYTHQVFEEDQDHIAHPRNQHRRVSHGSAAKSALQIKKEQYEQSRVGVSDSPNDGDVDMDRAEEQDHAEPEEQTPGEQIEQEVALTRERPAKAVATQSSQSEAEGVVPETQAVDPLSSATLSAESNDTPAEVPPRSA